MGFASSIGKYKLGRAIGEGTFAKVKLGVNSLNGEYVAIKILDKKMVMESHLKYQVQREIRTMKLLNHPNIVRIHEVLGTKTKIYIVMEYVSGGQLSDKLSYARKLNENEARKLFQQLIDAVDYCHNKGVYHRDLKPANLLLDSKGNLKLSDFGLSAMRKPDNVLTTACGSPSYVAPELLWNKGYDGAAADVWSCGVILFELLSGNLPFDDHNLMNLYKKICRADYTCPPWFTISQRKLIGKILEPRVTKLKMHPKRTMTRCSRSFYDLSATVIEVTPAHCVVEISKSAGDLRTYKEFCESLSNLLIEKSETSSQSQESEEEDQDAGRSEDSNSEDSDKSIHDHTSA